MLTFDFVLKALREGHIATREDYWRYTKYIFIGEATPRGVLKNKEGNIIFEVHYGSNATIWKPDVHDIMGKDWTIIERR